MRSFLFILGIGIAFSIASCSKNSADGANYLMIPDTGTYYIKTGTITVIRPDSTHTYDASKDNIAIYHNSKNNPDLWRILCFGNNGFVEIDARGAPVIGDNILTYSSASGLTSKNLSYNYLSYSNTNAGTITLTTYNSNGIAASGTFSLNVGTYLNSNNRLGFTNYTITGSFDLKLNPK